MKKINIIAFVSIITMLSLLSSCNNNNNNTKTIDSDENEIPSLTLEEFNNNPEDYVDEKIEVKGIVDHVCKHSGKKILLVADNAELHVFSNDRFDEELSGHMISVVGTVKENRVDNDACSEMEHEVEDALDKGEIDEDTYKAQKNNIEHLRDSMKIAKSNHLSFYSLEYISHNVITE